MGLALLPGMLFCNPRNGCSPDTVNIRLSPEDLLYTMQHAEDEVVLVYKDFIPLMEKLADKLETVKHYVVMTDDKMP